MSRVTVPEEAQQDYKQKIELLKSQLKSDANDSSFLHGNLDDVEDEPKSVVHAKSRMKALQHYEDVHGSKTESKKPRRDRDDDPEVIKQIQKAIKDERTARQKKKKDKPPK